MWQFPWRYKESFIIATGLFFCGILLQIASPVTIPLICFPYNVVIGILLILTSSSLLYFCGKNQVVIWLSGIPASISAIVLFSSLSLLIGFIPQHSVVDRSALDFGFTHVVSSWPYLFSEIYLLIILCMVTIRRIFPFRWTNTGFILNHVGLIIVLSGIALGAGDKQKILMNLYESQLEWKGYNEKNQIVELPLAIKLKKFVIDDYNPSMVFVDNATGDVIKDKTHGQQFLIDSGLSVTKYGYKINIIRYLADASFFNDAFLPFKSKGSVPAAFIQTVNSSGQVSKGWISCGNYISPQIILRLDKSVSIAMEMPRPKKYCSEISIYSKEKPIIETSIEVNKPFSFEGWKIYQTGFDEKMGKWSNLSVIQLVRDPWLSFIYTGFFMLMAGAGFVIWRGRNNNKTIK